MKKICKKIISIILIFICILSTSIHVSNAAEITEASIYYEYECDWVLQYLKPTTNKWTYVRTFYTIYKAPDGNTYPTYCLNHELNGVSGLNGGVPSYTVSINKLIDDDRVWRVITNGYPYKTPEEIGVQNQGDAYTATKHAVYSVLYNHDIRSYYRASQKSTELNQRGEQVVSAIERLADIGRNGTDTRLNGKMQIQKVNEFEKINEEYYSQEYKVTANAAIKEYEVSRLLNFPEGTKVTDVNGNEKVSFIAGENFKIFIPIKSVKSDILGEIYVTGKCKTYPIFYGESPSPELQNYAVCYDTYGTAEGSTTLFKEIKGKFSAKKVAKDNNIWSGHEKEEGVEGAKYELLDKEGKVIDTFVSDKKGIIAKDYELPIGTYILKEKESPKYFIKDKKEYKIEITEDKQEIEIEIKEEVKKGGYLTFNKTSTDKNMWNGNKEGTLLANAIYQIKNEKQEVLYELTTNEQGTIEEPIKLEVGKYYIQEIQAPEHYILDNQVYEFEIKENEQHVHFEFKNQSKPTPKLPKTGF